MTGKEILQVIEESGVSVSSFAYGDFGVPDDFELPEELRAQREAYTKHWELDYNERQGKETPKYDRKAADKYWQDQTGIGAWEEVDSYGGEDQGSTWYSIKHFMDHNVYIRTDGYYQSYNGVEFYKGYGREVTPKKKTITVFE